MSVTRRLHIPPLLTYMTHQTRRTADSQSLGRCPHTHIEAEARLPNKPIQSSNATQQTSPNGSNSKSQHIVARVTCTHLSSPGRAAPTGKRGCAARWRPHPFVTHRWTAMEQRSTHACELQSKESTPLGGCSQGGETCKGRIVFSSHHSSVESSSAIGGAGTRRQLPFRTCRYARQAHIQPRIHQGTASIGTSE